jgi:superfamily I DNA/RNA helicase
LANEIWIAGAGSGKTHKIVTDAIATIKQGGRVLVITYTINNQTELRSRFLELNGGADENFVVKGLFSFYLEDMIRPYQNVVFSERINSHVLTESNPHLKPGTTIYLKGRAETLKNGNINPLHYLTSDHDKVYSGLMAKLACRIADASSNAAAKRLSDIYQKIFFDEVQDLVGWDYDVIQSLTGEARNSICCVGDFRQTIYTTTYGHKHPETALQKIDFLVEKLKFNKKTLPKNRRCIQTICDLADTIHAGLYEKTESGVDEIPHSFSLHSGPFFVKQSDVQKYLEIFQPQVLRWSVTTGTRYLPQDIAAYTFGKSKGLGFDRTLVIPPDKHLKFILGDKDAFAKEKTEESRNKLYVAITRARYSLAFVIKDKETKNLPYPLWNPAAY